MINLCISTFIVAQTPVYSGVTNIKSHYLRISDSLNYGLEIEKIDFLKILPIFNFCQEMNKKAYFFSIFHFRFHGNHDYLFLAFFSNILSKKLQYFGLPYPRGNVANVCVCAFKQ